MIELTYIFKTIRGEKKQLKGIVARDLITKILKQNKIEAKVVWK